MATEWSNCAMVAEQLCVATAAAADATAAAAAALCYPLLMHVVIQKVHQQVIKCCSRI